jgi:hypothetical protein
MRPIPFRENLVAEFRHDVTRRGKPKAAAIAAFLGDWKPGFRILFWV